MKYTTLNTVQLLALALVMSVLSAVLVSVNSWYMLYIKLPVVHYDKTNACVKVENFENGHAFNCQDVDVLLRQYRKRTE
jgi:hypothetical protein